MKGFDPLGAQVTFVDVPDFGLSFYVFFMYLLFISALEFLQFQIGPMSSPLASGEVDIGIFSVFVM